MIASGYQMQSQLNPEKLIGHSKHKIEIAWYGPRGVGPVNYALECLTCGTVLADCEKVD